MHCIWLLFQGAIQGPQEFAEGLALGVRSLVGHAVGAQIKDTFTLALE